MFREQVINFLEAAVVFLLMTNAIGVLAAMLAIRMVKVHAPAGRDTAGVVERKLDTIFRRAR